MADEGSGATVTFGTSAFAASFVSITPDSITREALPTGHLGTTGGESYIPSDGYEPGGVTLQIQHDPDVQPAFAGVKETVTITYPVPSGKNVGATLVSSGFVDDYQPGSAERKSIMEASVHVKFSGDLTFNDATT